MIPLIYILFIIIPCISHWYSLGKGRERRRQARMDQNQPSSKEGSDGHEVMDERVSLGTPGGIVFLHISAFQQTTQPL